MKVLIVLLIAGLFALISTLFLDKGKERGSSRSVAEEHECRYVQRYSYFNPNPMEKIDKKTGEPKSWGKGDCVIRAFCGVLDLPWEKVYSEICRVGAECHDLPNTDEVIERYAKEKGLVKRILRPQTSISMFAESHDGTYLVCLRRHAVCVKNNKVYDTGDCGRSKMKTYYEMGVSVSERDVQLNQSKRTTRKQEPSVIEKEILEELEKDSILGLDGKHNQAYTYFNPNPDADFDKTTGKPLAHKKSDSVMRAFCGVLGLSWDDVYSDLCKVGAEIHDMPDSRKVIAQYARANGLVRRTLPSPMTLSQFAKTHDGVYLVQLSWGLSPELTCVKDNKVNDIWDYSSSTIRTYYERA